MRLRDFKAKYMSMLLELRKRLAEKYPEKKDRVNYIIDILMAKLENLRAFTLPDYLFTIYLATKEFKEFEEVVPPKSEIESLLKSEKE